MRVPASSNPRPLTRRQRLTRQRRAARLKLGRVFEIVHTDMMMWASERPLREPRARVEVDLRHVDAADEAGWNATVARLPPFRARRTTEFFERGDTGFVALVDGRFAGWIWLSRVSHRDP